ncbi:probable 2-oxoglutarate dehydrogenase E1 component DHKTD1 homolog, mitochondrial [Bolinopsis microptera]|uniref:probable 2-oxoglutarate dehydrogenase E1 component DHKTD1 homolog, mitochondrial n=1 Tax=Bolinopsis microptera TaxID=2820187 RepID=UPI00307A480C
MLRHLYHRERIALTLTRCVSTNRTQTPAEKGKRGYQSDSAPQKLLNEHLQDKEAEELIKGYRSWGYRHAATSPFGHSDQTSPLTEILSNSDDSKLRKVLDGLYCGGIGVQFMHIPDTDKQNFISDLIENRPVLSEEELVRVTQTLIRCENLDNFLANKYSNLKQYGGQGAEGTVAFCELLFNLCPRNKVEDVVIAIAHRGRISLLTELLQLPYLRLLKKYGGDREFHPDERSIGDVLSHLWQSADLEQPSGGNVHVSLLPNPSHLEVANSVALGKVRAKQRLKKSAPYYGDSRNSPLALLIHGDAAFSGQGVSMENAMMSKLDGYSSNGSVHLITNNLIGFTAQQGAQCSSFTAGDIGRMYDVPVLSVDGLDIHSIYQAAVMAIEWRTRYQEDIIIDLQCYRLHGHNQHDEPRFTNPLMYNIIDQLKPLQDRIVSELVKDQVVPEDFVKTVEAEQNVELSSAHKTCADYTPPRMCFTGNWDQMTQAGSDLTTWQTGYNLEDLRCVGVKSTELPEGFQHHPTLNRAHINKRAKMMETGEGIDWAMGEALAFGSLLLQGYNVRLSGEDVSRGTFSNRHVTMYDQNTGHPYTSLNHLHTEQTTKLEAIDSLLSEEGVVGFEYGYSLEDPNSLVLWEAQFGDFFNPAQVIFDQFVVSGEAKWVLQSGLVSLLPHGYDGNGPDHTSARLERWLQLSDSKECTADTDDVNVQVANCTTPAQYFHLLRRQMVRPFRKPLVLMSPKALLRSPDAVSQIAEFGPGSTFQRVIGDAAVHNNDVKRVLICSGKHYYTLRNKRNELKDKSTAIIRVEELCPFPSSELQQELNKYPDAGKFWAQEESRNSGAWSFVNPRVKNILGHELEYAGRSECAAAAVGVSKVHAVEVKEILNQAFSHVL